MTATCSTTELPHGWTVADVTALVLTAVRVRRGRIIARDEACEVARLAVIERLHAEETPTRLDLYRAANRALDSANDKELAYRGFTRATPGREHLRPRFAAYWHGLPVLFGSFEETVTDRMAAMQVWEALPQRHRDALGALAAQGSILGAADMLGLPVKAYRRRIYAARAEARGLWHAPDPVAPQWGADFPGSKQTVVELMSELRKRDKKRIRAARLEGQA